MESSQYRRVVDEAGASVSSAAVIACTSQCLRRGESRIGHGARRHTTSASVTNKWNVPHAATVEMRRGCAPISFAYSLSYQPTAPRLS